MEKKYSNSNVFEYEKELFEVVEFKRIYVNDCDLVGVSFYIDINNTNQVFEVKEFIDDENLKYERIEKMNKEEFNKAVNSY